MEGEKVTKSYNYLQINDASLYPGWHH